MTEERRKVAVMKAAIPLAARSFRVNRRDIENVDALKDEEIWRDLDWRSKDVWRKDAQAALEAVGYFGLVDAATAFLAGVPVLDTEAEQCRLQDALADALKEVR